MEENRSLTPQEVADILKIAKNTVYELIKRGELNAYRVGKKVRVDMRDVEEYKTRMKTSRPKTTEGVEGNRGASASSVAAVSPGIPSAEIPPMSSVTLPPNKEIVICGQDVMLDILSRYLERHPKGVRTLRSYIGSYNGLYALYQGNVQLATAHLWDSDSGQYNIPYVRRMLPGFSAVVVHLACRWQGLYVAKNNPKSIHSWEDLKRPELSIINREKGSGTRVLLDEHLKKMGISPAKLNGYTREVFSHLAVASIVARGEADFGLGNEKTALQVQEIDYIPLQKERYDLVIRKEDLDKPPFTAVLEIIRSPEFRAELEGLGGYDLQETGKITEV